MLPQNEIPLIKRRLISMVYEGFLVFGVLFIADLLFEALTRHHQTLPIAQLRQIWLFVIVGVYFIVSWRRGGQTLAMKTWRLKLVTPSSTQISLKQATLRYIFCWMWFLPALALGYAVPMNNWSRVGLIGVGLIAWTCTALFNNERQFLHDRWAGTAIVNDLTTKASKTASESAQAQK